MMISLLLSSIGINIVLFIQVRTLEYKVNRLNGNINKLKNKRVKNKQYSSNQEFNRLIENAFKSGSSTINLRGSNNIKLPQRRVY